VNASVFILFTFGQNEEEKFPHGHSLSALETVEFRGFELFKLSTGFAMLLSVNRHRWMIHAETSNKKESGDRIQETGNS
jgi:hypothetical protein